MPDQAPNTNLSFGSVSSAQAPGAYPRTHSPAEGRSRIHIGSRQTTAGVPLAARLETTELLREPTEALLRIRKKCEGEQCYREPSGQCYVLCPARRKAFNNTPVSASPVSPFWKHFSSLWVEEEPTQARRVLLQDLPSEFRPAGTNIRSAPMGCGRTFRKLRRLLIRQ